MRMQAIMVSVGLLVGLNLGAAWAEGVAPAGVTPTGTELQEGGLILRAVAIYPQTLILAPNAPASLCFVNGSGDPGMLSLQLPTPVTVEAKENEITELKLTALAPGDYAVQFKPKKAENMLNAILHVGSLSNTGTVQEVSIITGFQKFKPEVTRLKAHQPAVVYMYTAAWFVPHGDMEIFGTEAKFKLKSKVLETVELKQGLAPGVYPISRPGYPKQNHGIKSRVVVE